MLTELSWLTSECKFEGKTGEGKSENRLWQEWLPGFKKETRTNRNKLGNALVTHSFITKPTATDQQPHLSDFSI